MSKHFTAESKLGAAKRVLDHGYTLPQSRRNRQCQPLGHYPLGQYAAI